MPAHNARSNLAASSGTGTSSSGVTITQTYATADPTHADFTSGVLVLTATQIAAATASLTLVDSDVASLAAMKVTNDQLAKSLGANINAIRADLLDLKQLVNSIVDALQTTEIVD